MSNLIMLSGGIESTTLAKKLLKEGVELEGIYFDTGESPKALEITRAVAKEFNLPLEIVDISGTAALMRRLFPDEYLLFDEMDGGGGEFDRAVFPNGVVPPSAFPVLLANATYYAQVRGIDVIYLGVEKDQVGGRRGFADFYENWSKTLTTFNPNGKQVQLECPFLEYTKKEVIRLALELELHQMPCGVVFPQVSNTAVFALAALLVVTPSRMRELKIERYILLRN